MKVVQYILPFQSIDGVNYEIQIYGEDDGREVKTLTGADTPFETSEDASEDYFEPIRTQTANIHIINDNGLLTLGDILPQNDVDRLVRLVNTKTGEVEWQGFLVCETYSQEYNSRPHSIDLNAQSVLGAIGSLQMPKDMIVWRQKINNVITLALTAAIRETGIKTLMRDIYFDYVSRNVFDKYIDYVRFLSEKEQINENNITWEIEAISPKEVLEYVCRMMGYVCREVGQDIYLLPNDNVINIRKQKLVEFGVRVEGTDVTRSVIPMTDLTYKGVGHNINTRSGARSVEVAANIEKYDLNLSIPPCPVGTLHELYEHLYSDYIYALLNTNHLYYSGKNEYAYYKCSLSPQMGRASNYSTTTRKDVLDNLLIVAKQQSPAYQNAWESGTAKTFRAGAMLAKIAFDGGGKDVHDTQDGLYLSLFPGMVPDGTYTPQFDMNSVGPIYTMHTLLPVAFVGGYFVLNAEAMYIAASGNTAYWGDHGYAGEREPFGGHSDRSPEALVVAVRIGDWYWNGAGWFKTPFFFTIDFDEKGKIAPSLFNNQLGVDDGYAIPLLNSEVMQGQVWFYIYPNAGYIKDAVGRFGYGRYASEMFFTKLSIDYNIKNETKLTDRGENTYYRLLGLNFKEDVSISTNIASDLNNLPSPSMLLDTQDDYYGAQTIRYEFGNAKPEHHLLNRMASYYGKQRSIISIEIEPPQNALPMTKFTGYDGKTYIPLSENRNWKTDTSTVQCFECPE